MTAGELVLIVGMALAVYLPKVVPLVVVSPRMTARLERWLRYVAPAVLGALVAPSILAPSGIPMLNLQQLGFVAAFAMAIASRRMLPSLAVGLVVLALTTMIGG